MARTEREAPRKKVFSKRAPGNRRFMDTHGLEYAFVRSTEAAAIAAGRLVGLGDKNAVDGAAVEAMRTALRDAALAGVVVIGEGEKDEAPMLYHGEEVGDGRGPPRTARVSDRRHHAGRSRGSGCDLGHHRGSARGALSHPRAIHGEARDGPG